ncbi:uncharacterized protein LOC107659279 [Sinocyclocheilus anshuiensis]|uniref:uncharacterized protein LOC107659279 n=1 Tax=Sinocyclocheilus anshuiensis TaxID=1608454 RepID=UPI0007B8F5F2|nr:PREDICTED: uncharacterized protein LOC107659279 [Sinocyclocheilus anshuiensis]
MSDECHLCLLGLIVLSSLLTGSSGVDDAHVFISSGEDVHLSCNNALPDCNSTTWNYNRFRHSATDELIALGKKKNNTERHERLSLGSDCSLNIRHISKEDYGPYSCQQWTGVNRDQQQEPDARVYLHVLHVSSSQTEISAGRSVTLFCQLYSYPRVSCDDWICSERIELFWVNQTGVKLTRSDSRYQISAPGHCISSLNTTLLNEDHNREWRCNVTQRDQVKTSVTYTVKSSAQADSTTAVTSTQVIVIVVCASFALLLPALILWLMIRKKRATVRRATDDSVQQTDDVTYTEVTAYSKNRAKKNKVRCDDKVTYASIGGAKAGAQENCSQLYASVNKNHHKSGR